MIVRDEAHCISRCLNSVKPHISSWCVVDTGSTDDTAQEVQRCLDGITGQLHSRPWVDFGHNRTEAYRLAPPAEWYLLIDADETFHGALDLDALPKEGYSAMVRLGGSSFPRATLLPMRPDWHWVGRVDERIEPNPHGFRVLDGCRIESHSDGGRHSEGWMGRDIALLLQDWHEDKNPRTAFHLANRYKLVGDDSMALSWYLQRVRMQGGWHEEAVVSAREAAGICRKIGQGFLADELDKWAGSKSVMPLLNLA